MSELPIEIDVLEVERLLADGEIVLIDCREESESEISRIDGAVGMPMSRWGEMTPQLDRYAGKRFVVHCHHGGRSLRVTQWMRENGFYNTQNMSGGIDAWSRQVDPTVPQY